MTIARNTPCRLQIKMEEKLCVWEVGTGKKFVKFLRREFDHVLLSHINFFLESDLKKVDQLT